MNDRWNTAQEAAAIGGWTADMVREAARANLFDGAEQVEQRWRLPESSVRKWTQHPAMLEVAILAYRRGIYLDHPSFVSGYNLQIGEHMFISNSSDTTLPETAQPESELAPIAHLPEPTTVESRRSKRSDGRRDISRLIAEGSRVVALDKNGFGTGWWFYRYPAGLSENSATPGRMRGKVESQLLASLELHPEVRAKILEHHGLNRSVMYYQVQNGEESHQGLTNAAQAGGMVEEFLDAQSARWCSAQDAKKAQ